MTHDEQRGVLQRMDNIAIVVDDLEAAKAFFAELGMELEGQATVEGDAVDRLIGLKGVRTDIAMMRDPNGSGRVELTRYHTPPSPDGEPLAVNAVGMHRIMFAVRGIDDLIDRLRHHGAEPLGEVMQYENSYRIAYLRGPSGIFVALAEELG
jgi:catechol 2,3-dioxygenase-like lactoylglutathione lyase family enzyme